MQNIFSFHNLPLGIFVCDFEFKIIFCNILLLNLTGNDEQEYLNKRFSVLPLYEPRDNRTKLNLSNCIKQHGVNDVNKTAVIKHINGLTTLVFLNAKQVEVGGNLYYLFTVTDISKEMTCNSIIKSSKEEDVSKYNMVGQDEKLKEIYKMIDMAADSEANVLIYGESGTGKELIANAIHYLSARHNKPFVKVNCSSLSETLLESELFGHVKGSFTGAIKDKPGKFEIADQGTIFLDEIGEISPMIQVKLLRVIQEKTIERVGDNKPIKVNMRIITATNKNLRQMVSKGSFREDLYYRLNVFPINTVPLREHKNDIPILVDYFVKRFNKKTGKQVKGLTEDAYRILLDYCWPGNVRELENSIEHAFVLCNSANIDVFDLPQDIRLVQLRKGLCKNIELTNQPAYYFDVQNELTLDTYNPNVYWKNISKEQLIEVLNKHQWNKSKAAESLGVSRVAFWKKIKKFGL